MAQKTEKSGARDAIILAIVVVLVAGYCVAFGLQTLVWGEAHHWAKYDPWLNDVPGSLNASAAAPGKTQLRAFDYQFKVPWTGKEQTRGTLTYSEFRFDSGQVVILYDPNGQSDTLRDMRSENPLAYQQLQNVFVGQTLDTNYDLYNVVYGASANATSPFMSTRDAIRLNQLLLWKISFGLDASPGAYAISMGGNRGFQFGDPSTGRPVALRVFDGTDSQLRLIFLTEAGSSAKIDQADIDCAVESLGQVPVSER
ncbi:MAG TPA: hypothetical protein VMH00_03265 [Candidatus Limnocylindrales bacterium]|nr:hypothetical protein [Candidatus Limnocylindrales bacterium]